MAAGITDGLKQAARGLSVGLDTAAETMVRQPARSLQQGDRVTSVVARALKAAPAAAAAPASATAAAVRDVFLGIRNSLDPERASNH